ncbi:MAG: ECF transporter S component [Clostridia bacterium]|nr:ECF transporter S component [Clostridia bacterium]
MSQKKVGLNVAIVGIFAALVVVLQFMSAIFPIGQFNLTLTLIPIVLGAVLYGPRVGAALGAIFGAVVVICCFTGLDVGGSILVQTSPILTTAVCMAKGILAGVLPGIVFNAAGKRKPYFGTVLAAISAPVGNTGLFLICMLLFFKSTLVSWAGGADTVYYIFTGLTGWNFLIELAINAVAAPLLYRVTKAVRHI